MKLVILTQYFPPETGAPQNRLFELAVRLKELGLDITVLTAMPNYPQMKVYKGYRGKKDFFEMIGDIPVYRSSIYIPKTMSVIQRLLNCFSFVISSARNGRKVLNQADYIFCESPPLFLGLTAIYLAKKYKAALIFNVADLWPESAEKLNIISNKFLLWLAYRLESVIYKRSVLVTGQAKGICDDISHRFPGKDVYWLPNGVDLNYYDPSQTKQGSWRTTHGFRDDELIILYAGILGVAQGLEVLLHAASRLRARNDIRFVIIGDGPEKEKLLDLCKRLELENVRFLEAVSKSDMPGILAETDMSVVPLKKLDLFRGAIPSKLFELLAMQIPVILGVDGESRELFIDEGRAGLYFEPENPEHLSHCILKLADNAELRRELGENGRKYAFNYFNRDVIASEFHKKLKSIDKSNDRIEQ